MIWRLWRAFRNDEGKAKLAKVNPPPISKKTSKKIKGTKDPRGFRRNSDLN